MTNPEEKLRNLNNACLDSMVVMVVCRLVYLRKKEMSGTITKASIKLHQFLLSERGRNGMMGGEETI